MSELEREEPYWIVVTKVAKEEYATATVDAPTEEDARAEGERVISAGEGTAEYEVKNVQGPFPRSPGEAAPEVRPEGCGGCARRCWDGENPPTPRETWFSRDGESAESVRWECIQCGTWTHLPKGGTA